MSSLVSTVGWQSAELPDWIWVGACTFMVGFFVYLWWKDR